jgi:hypothetical protein
MENQELIKELAKQGAIETLEALAMAQSAGLVKTPDDLRELIEAGMESVLEEYIIKNNSATKIILDPNEI